MRQDRFSGPSPDLDLSETAFFFDFDGTLAAIVDHPDRASINGPDLENLQKLYGRADAALAIISGREISDVDKRLSSWRPAASGVHGLEWRLPDGTCHRIHQTIPEQMSDMLRQFAECHDGLLLECKHGSMALHYRVRPDLEACCRDVTRRISRSWDEVQTIAGRMVIEFRMGAETKGDAIAFFMSRPPFRGRCPVFVGDDVTDEAGFRVVERLNGITVKVGSGVTHARYRLADSVALHKWIAALLDQDCAARQLPQLGLRPSDG